MREIKFRAWDSYNGKMLDNHEPLVWNSVMPMASHMGSEPKNFIVMQFTGLTDCNGVKIFENDIIIQHAEWNETSYFGNGESECDSFEVEFIGVVSITASKGVVINSVKKMDMIIGGGWVRHPHSINVRGTRSRVIGNIHQNPELLERTHG